MSDKKSTAKEPLTDKEIALELTRLCVQLKCAYASQGWRPAPPVIDVYNHHLAEINKDKR